MSVSLSGLLLKVCLFLSVCVYGEGGGYILHDLQVMIQSPSPSPGPSPASGWVTHHNYTRYKKKSSADFKHFNHIKVQHHMAPNAAHRSNSVCENT